MTNVAVHVGADGNPNGGYATVYGDCDPKEGWYEVTMDPLMDLDFIRRYKIVDGNLVLKESGKTTFETVKDEVSNLKKIITQQQQVSLNSTVSQNDLLRSASQVQQVNKEVVTTVNEQAKLITSLQDQIGDLKKQVDSLKEKY